MIFTDTGFEGLIAWTPKTFEDRRGHFCEGFSKKTFPVTFDTYQVNHSVSKKNVIRGLHYQKNPFAQAKIIHAVKGKIFDVALDLRKDSKTFGKYYGIELSEENKKRIYIPKGFAHGFSVLSEEAVIVYQTDAHFSPGHTGSIKYNDKTLAIDWRVEGEAILSDADLNAVTFEEYLKNPSF